MKGVRKSDQPSRRARMRYSIRKFQAPFRSELDNLSMSSTSSGDSFSINSDSTAVTELSLDAQVDLFEDLQVQVFNLNTAPDAWPSQQWQVFKQDLVKHLQAQPSLISHNYMVRLRVACKSGHSWRPCILLSTQSAETKLTLASYFLSGPPIINRFLQCGLDLHIVRSDIKSLCAAEVAMDLPPEHNSKQIWIEPQGPGNVVQILVEDNTSEQRSFAVGGGSLLIAGKRVIPTAFHVLDSPSSDHTVPSFRQSAKVSDPKYFVDGAISIYYDDIQDGQVRLDCADEALDSFKPRFPERKKRNAGAARSSFRLPSNKCLDGNLKALRRRIHRFKANASVITRKLVEGQAATRQVLQNSQNAHGATEAMRRARVLYAGADLDWALLEIDSVKTTNNGLERPLNTVGGHIIDDVLEAKVCDPIDVTLPTPHGEISGRLLPETVAYHAGGRHLELQVVRLSTPLRRGTSGTWVTHCNHLCGMVLAGDNDLPEVFILPASVLLDDIRKVSGAEVSLSLIPAPDHNDIQTLLESQTNELLDVRASGQGPTPHWMCHSKTAIRSAQSISTSKDLEECPVRPDQECGKAKMYQPGEFVDQPFSKVNLDVIDNDQARFDHNDDTNTVMDFSTDSQDTPILLNKEDIALDNADRLANLDVASSAPADDKLRAINGWQGSQSKLLVYKASQLCLLDCIYLVCFSRTNAMMMIPTCLESNRYILLEQFWFVVSYALAQLANVTRSLASCGTEAMVHLLLSVVLSTSRSYSEVMFWAGCGLLIGLALCIAYLSEISSLNTILFTASGFDTTIFILPLIEKTHRRRRLHLPTARFIMRTLGGTILIIPSLCFSLYIRPEFEASSGSNICQSMWTGHDGNAVGYGFDSIYAVSYASKLPHSYSDMTESLIEAYRECVKPEDAAMHPLLTQKTSIDALWHKNVQDRSNDPLKNGENEASSIVDSNQIHPQCWAFLINCRNWAQIGTTHCWFLPDVGFHVRSLDSPRLLEELYLCNSTLMSTQSPQDRDLTVFEPNISTNTTSTVNITSTSTIVTIYGGTVATVSASGTAVLYVGLGTAICALLMKFVPKEYHKLRHGILAANISIVLAATLVCLIHIRISTIDPDLRACVYSFQNATSALRDEHMRYLICLVTLVPWCLIQIARNITKRNSRKKR